LKEIARQRGTSLPELVTAINAKLTECRGKR
jgi:hypothetical protein